MEKPTYEELEQKIKGLEKEVSELKEANKELQACEKYRAIFETTGMATVIVDEDFTISLANKRFEELSGYSKDEIENKKTWMEFVVPEDLERMKHQHTLRRNEPGAALKNYEFRFKDVHGNIRHILLSINMIPGSTQSVASLLDVTERIEQLDEIRKKEEKYRTIFNNSIDCIYIHDMEGNFLDANVRALELFGYSKEDIPHLNITSLMSEDQHEKAFKTLATLIEGNEEITEYKIHGRDGSVRHVETKGTVLYDQNGQPYAVLGIARDVTRLKQAQQERKKVEAQLQQAQKMEAIGTLAGGIAHDFNNILTSINGYTELTMGMVEKETLLYDNLSEVLKAGKRATDLVKQILAISRDTKEEIKPIQVKPLIKEVLKLLRSTIPTSIEFKEDICEEALIVKADPTQLHQVIVNLATNAVQAMAGGTGILEVDVDPVTFDADIKKTYPDMWPGNFVRITVSDTGEGIPEENLDKICEPYFTTKEKGEGTGLGLSMVHGIVKAHKGHITVYSESGKGTTFHVYLPLVKKRPKEEEKPAEPLPTGSEHILLVDDEPPIVKMQQQMLEQLGYTVTARTSSLEALEAFRTSSQKFDIVLTDMAMPNMPGDQLAHFVKEIRPDIPVILFTGFSEAIEGQEASLEIDDFLMKPVDKVQMAKAVRKALDKGKGE